MLKNIGKLMLGSAFAVVAMSTPSAMAQDAWEVSSNVTFVSDYRFRGVSLSDDEFAVQGGFDLGHSSGFYVGTWASNIDADLGAGEVELDLYGGYGFDAGELGVDVGVIAYLYPGADDVDYYELYGSVGGDIGVAGWTLGVAYVPEQDNTGDADNTYFYGDLGVPLGESGVDLALHVGTEDGAFADEKFDYSIGVSKEVGGVGLGLSYVGADADGVDDAVVLSIGM